MQKLELVDEKWVNEKDEVVGDLVKVAKNEFAILTPNGEKKPIKLGWVDEKGTFFPICPLPFQFCANRCEFYFSKFCRFNVTMVEEGYYMLD